MKALHIQKHGGPEVLQFADLPSPMLPPGYVRVQVVMAALNHLDIWVRGGLPNLKLPMPHVLGSDGAGIVSECAPGVSNVKVGDAVILNPTLSCGVCEFCRSGEQSECVSFGVLGETRSGCYAEEVCVPAENVFLKPEKASWEESASFALVYTTAARMLYNRGRLRAGETVLITGIGGGVATAALHLAKLIPCRVIVTADSELKLQRARKMGSDAEINYSTTVVRHAIRELTNGRGVDLVIDSAGGETFQEALKSMRKGGRLVTCGATAGQTPPLEIQRVFWYQLEILGSTLGNDQDFRTVYALFCQGAFHPVVDRTYPLAQGAEAFARLKSGEQYGKVLLSVRQP